MEGRRRSQGLPEPCSSPPAEASSMIISGEMFFDDDRKRTIEALWATTEKALSVKKEKESAFVHTYQWSEAGIPKQPGQFSPPPPNGRYSGSFNHKDKTALRSVPDESNLTFTANSAKGWNISGKATNQFGAFDVTGKCSSSGEIIMWRVLIPEGGANVLQTPKRKGSSDNNARPPKTGKNKGHQTAGGGCSSTGGKEGALADNHNEPTMHPDSEVGASGAESRASGSAPSQNSVSSTPHTTASAATGKGKAAMGVGGSNNDVPADEEMEVMHTTGVPALNTVSASGETVAKREAGAGNNVGGSQEMNVPLGASEGGGSLAAMMLDAARKRRKVELDLLAQLNTAVKKASEEISKPTKKLEAYEGESRHYVDEVVPGAETEVAEAKRAVQAAKDAVKSDKHNDRLGIDVEIAKDRLNVSEYKLARLRGRLTWLEREAETLRPAVEKKAKCLRDMEESLKQTQTDVEAAEARVREAENAMK